MPTKLKLPKIPKIGKQRQFIVEKQIDVEKLEELLADEFGRMMRRKLKVEQ